MGQGHGARKRSARRARRLRRPRELAPAHGGWLRTCACPRLRRVERLQREDRAEVVVHHPAEQRDHALREPHRVRAPSGHRKLPAREEHLDHEHEEQHHAAAGRDAEHAAAQAIEEAEPRLVGEPLDQHRHEAERDQHDDEQQAVGEIDRGLTSRRGAQLGRGFDGGTGSARLQSPRGNHAGLGCAAEKRRDVLPVASRDHVGGHQDPDPADLPDEPLEDPEREEHHQHAQRRLVDPAQGLQRVRDGLEGRRGGFFLGSAHAVPIVPRPAAFVAVRCALRRGALQFCPASETLPPAPR